MGVGVGVGGWGQVSRCGMVVVVQRPASNHYAALHSTVLLLTVTKLKGSRHCNG